MIGARAAGALAPGGAKLVIRPEDIAMKPVSGDVGDGVVADVVNRQYLGAKTSYVVRLRSGEKLDADCTGAQHDAFLPGDSVMLIPDATWSLVIAS